MIDQGAYFAYPIVHGVSSTCEVLVVDEVQVPGDFPEAPAMDLVGDGGVVQERLLTPVVVH